MAGNQRLAAAVALGWETIPVVYADLSPEEVTRWMLLDNRRVHPTQKPTPLLAEILTRWAPDDCAVADPFAGSGSTLIAAEMTGRRCFAMEIDPAYCDVIRKRYADFVDDPSLAP